MVSPDTTFFPDGKERLDGARVPGQRTCATDPCATDPDVSLKRIGSVSEAERHRDVVAWNDTDRSVAPATFPALSEAQVARTPSLPALLVDGAPITYAELDAQANRLAHVLIGGGAGPEGIVALALPRSVDI